MDGLSDLASWFDQLGISQLRECQQMINAAISKLLKNDGANVNSSYVSAKSDIKEV